MHFVDNQKHYDPAFNLALEEYLLRNAKIEDSILLFYINEPSIIIGRNQNTVEEINSQYVEANHIHVVRRLSGGGAVYHDLGNLNFSFITYYHPQKVNNFSEFTLPVVQALNRLGVDAEVSGRNDILLNGYKISGNAQYISKDRMFSHGTLLFNSDLSCVAEALRVKQSKIDSKGIKSIRSRVANISDFLQQKMSVEEFRSYLLASIFGGADEISAYTLMAEDWKAVEELADSRYRSWEWNYGESPAYNLQKVHRFTAGEIDMRLNVDKGLIQCIKFFGDFFSQSDLADLESKLKGIRYSPDSILRLLQEANVGQYFLGVPQEEILEFIASPA